MRFSTRFFFVSVAAAFAIFTASAHAKPLEPSEVPAPLKSWTSWVMHDVQKNECPFFYMAQDQRVCMWPTSLELNLGNNAGAFTFVVTIVQTPDGNPQRVILPGQTDVWPQDVLVNGKSEAVLLFNGLPSVLLPKGEYTIRGNFVWDKMPVSLLLPAQVGIVNLALNDKAVAIPEIENGLLMLQRETQAEVSTSENRLDVKVFRKLTDSIPQMIQTRLQLNVSGKQREEVLGAILSEGNTPIHIQSDLPARLDSDGKLRAQLRAGTYYITIDSRLNALTNHFTVPVQNGVLPPEEIWSFEAQNNLRLVQLSGAPAIDPTQTELPPEWHALPSYYLKQGEKIDIQEIKRGAADAAPDQLNLHRKLWLDYSGKGYTVQDTMSGTIKSSTRLEVQDGVKLGSATINGQDQYITTITQDAKNSNPGVEVREGAFSMTSNSRFDRVKEIFATGWKNSFDSVYATLYLPPGWSLLGYSGVDSVSRSWISNWTLVDIFLVMITAVAAYRFWGRRLGIIAAVGLVLIHPELKSFTSLLLTAILCLAIMRALKPGKLQSFIGLFSKLVMMIIVLSALPFMLSHMREALYPQLANGSNWQIPDGFGGARVMQNMAANEMNDVMVDPAPAMAPESIPMDSAGSSSSYEGKSAYLAKKVLSKTDNAIQQQYQTYAPDTKVQTGFGNRNISENGISLRWNGSVDASVSMHLWLLSANMNLMLALIRVCLIAIMIAALIGGIIPRVREKMRFLFPVMMLACGIFVIPTSDVFASAPEIISSEPQEATTPQDSEQENNAFPSPALLQELKQKLSEQINRPESCLPECASLARTRIAVSGNQLDLELEIHTDADVAVPLPGGISNWRPAVVLINGEQAASLTVDGNGYLMVRLNKGVSKIRQSGTIATSRDTLGITFPLMSRYTSVDATGWAVQGVRENGITESSVQLNRTERSAAVAVHAESNFEKTTLPPFYQVERTLLLGNRWEVSTIVRKLTPADSSSAIEIPLLDGESVTSGDTQVKDAKAYASFDPGINEVAFTSVITQGTQMTLTAPVGTPWVEVWKLSASNLWHVKADGIPRIYEANMRTQDTANIVAQAASGYSLWMPWPGEKLTFTIERPAGVEGATRTIDATNVTLTPSSRSTDVSLEISLRSSLGGQHDITLPEGAVLSEVTRGGLVIPSQMKGNILTLPLTPGNNNFTLRWRETKTLGASYRPSVVGIGADRSVNSTINVTVPENRWILFTAGPLMGPAVLFWSWIPVILILSFGLGKIEATPLRMRHWFILLLGLSLSSISGIIMIIAWVLAFAWRGANEHVNLKNYRFNLMQIALVLLTINVMPMLFDCIKDGLLGYPQMNIAGNNSYANQLKWYQDITASVLPQPLIISVPIWVYRAGMLIWALWLAFKMVNWLRWSFESFTLGGYWRKVWDKKASETQTVTAQESETKA